MKDKAMDKLRDEMAKNAGDAGISALGEYMTARLQEDAGLAEKILDEKKNLAGAFGAVREYARKNQTGGFCAVSDQKAFEICCDYFGIGAQAPAEAPKTETKAAQGADIDLDALLEGL